MLLEGQVLVLHFPAEKPTGSNLARRLGRVRGVPFSCLRNRDEAVALSPCSDTTDWIICSSWGTEPIRSSGGPSAWCHGRRHRKCHLLKDVSLQMVKRGLRPGFSSGTISDCNFSENSCLNSLPPPVSIWPKSIQLLPSKPQICNTVLLMVPDFNPMPRSGSTGEETPSGYL